MKNQKHFSELTNAVLYDEDHHLLDDELGRLCRRHYELGICSDYTAGILLQRMRKHQLFLAFSGMPFRSPRLGHGNLVLGRDFQGHLVYIPIPFLNAHTLLVANSGAGKTTMSRLYALQVARHLRGLWLFDLRKREYRLLRRYLAAMGINLIIVPGRALKLNILQIPEGVEPSDFIPRIADCLTLVLALPPRASKIFQTTLHKLYRNFGVFEGKRLFPTLFDLFLAVKTDTDLNPPARLAILDSLEPVLRSIGPNIAYRRGWSTEDLARRHLVLEFAGLTETDKNLLLNYLLVSEFISRVARGVSNPRMDFLVMVDDAQRISSISQEHHSPVGDLITFIRGTGIGLFLGTQSTHGLLPQVMANTSLKILGRVGSMGDYLEMGRVMGLTSEQVQWAQHHLRPGLFIGQVGEGDWRYPFVFEVPRPKFDLDATEGTDSDPADRDPLPELPVTPMEDQS